MIEPMRKLWWDRSNYFNKAIISMQGLVWGVEVSCRGPDAGIWLGTFPIMKGIRYAGIPMEVGDANSTYYAVFCIESPLIKRVIPTTDLWLAIRDVRHVANGV